MSGSVIISTQELRRSGGMADATVSKTVEGNLVRVQLPPSAPGARRGFCRGVAQPGRAPRSGRGGRWFKSTHPDQQSCIPITWDKTTNPCRVALFFIPDYSMATTYDHLHYPGSGLKQGRVQGFAPHDLPCLPRSGRQKQGVRPGAPTHLFSVRLLWIIFNQEG